MKTFICGFFIFCLILFLYVAYEEKRVGNKNQTFVHQTLPSLEGKKIITIIPNTNGYSILLRDRKAEEPIECYQLFVYVKMLGNNENIEICEK